MSNIRNICSNCGNSLRGRYCHDCGQRANEPRRAVIGLVQDFFVETLWLDGRLLRSIGLLLWKPGRLARYYLDGKRVRYTPPFRMYLFASVFFFFLTFLLIGSAGNTAIDDETIAIRDFVRGIEEGIRDDSDRPAPADGESPDATPPGEGSIEPESEGGASGEASSPDGGSSWFDQTWEEMSYTGPAWFEPHARRLHYATTRVIDEPRLYLNSLQNNLPRVLLLAPLFYASLLALFYIYRRKFVFYDHLVVSLYMHAALYAYLLIALILSMIPLLGWLVPFLLIWPALQPYAVLRQAYGSNWVSVVGKGFLITSIYNIVVFILVLFGVSYALYQS
ncbi:DUF3667 domain-containing protein [Aquisalinus flavus]|uniref:DUF3667 domain-containing protein n=1 Tax=Aquisalinus flavus TaxID=1526572 RepID=A0A8J2V2Y1_9PROT|nr:DUF3667 domain-containing protein [Aquisalinus flavus]MBD0426325.1 DUF3667 domain-containing protein [Aquisalinus flavus]UNE48109.1 DUF3667 domain-containing protein [Aquisalinus flavus]GGD08873.1 hypothetical protein GCM10011342_17120 [Aquisalinus flavus]